MNDFDTISEDFCKEVEAKIGRPMTPGQRAGVKSSGTLMFLEVVMMGFDYAKTPEAVEKWLTEMETFRRET